jgi:hypothetical protein
VWLRRSNCGTKSRNLVRFAAWFAIVVLAASSGARAGEGAVVFSARIGDLMINSRYIAEGRGVDDVVELALPGALHDPPAALGVIPRAQTDPSTPLGAAQADFSAWKADDPDWILSNFAEPDRLDLMQFLLDPDMRAASRAGFERYDTTFVWGVVMHADYALVLMTHGQDEDRSRGLVATFAREAGAWRRTNALSADETLDLVWSAFRAGQMSTGQ